MKKIRIISLILIVIMLFTTACSSSESADNTGNEVVEASETQEK